MPGPGALPKETRSRTRDSAARDAITAKLKADGTIRGPELPEGDWPAQTLTWWMNLRSSPMAQQWIAADWDALLDTAVLHRELWSGDLKVAPEIRLRMQQFGVTPESRLRLRISVDTETAEAKAATPVVQPDRRRRLLKVVENGGA